MPLASFGAKNQLSVKGGEGEAPPLAPSNPQPLCRVKGLQSGLFSERLGGRRENKRHWNFRPKDTQVRAPAVSQGYGHAKSKELLKEYAAKAPNARTFIKKLRSQELRRALLSQLLDPADLLVALQPYANVAVAPKDKIDSGMHPPPPGRRQQFNGSRVLVINFL